MENLGEFSDIDDRQLVADAVALAHRETALVAAKLAHIAEIERRRLAMKLGASSVARWWARGLRISQGSADRQISIGQWLTDWPTVRSAFAAADIHLTHVNAIADGLAAVIAADPQLGGAAIVEDLLHVALDGTAHTVQRRAQTLALSAAADAQRRADAQKAEERQRPTTDHENDAPPEPTAPGDAPEEKAPPEPATPGDAPDEPSSPPPPLPLPPPVSPAENADLNRLAIRPLPNGRHQVDGDVDVLLAEKLKNALAPYSAPRPGPNGERDPRSPAKRTADALSDLLDRKPGSGKRSEFAGIVDLTDLTDLARQRPTDTADTAESGPVPPPFVPPQDWPFHLAWAGPVSHALALLVTCDADMTPTVVDGAGVPLAMGPTVRTVTDAQRTAVIVRDRCCILCGRPAQWCQVHHLIHWAHGGPTDLTNSALLCSECHRQVHQQGWDIVLGEDHHPWVIPPAHLDPDRQPRPSYHRRQRKKAA